jgi:hypothetical protein
MRSLVVSLVFLVAAAPTARAQQPATPASIQQPDLRPVVTQLGVAGESPATSQVAFDLRARSAARETTDLDPSARNALAIIGAVVIVIALVALIR